MEIRVFRHKIRALSGDIGSNIAALFFRDIGNTIEAVFDGDIYLYIHQKRKIAIFFSGIVWFIEVYNEHQIDAVKTFWEQYLKDNSQITVAIVPEKWYNNN